MAVTDFFTGEKNRCLLYCSVNNKHLRYLSLTLQFYSNSVLENQVYVFCHLEIQYDIFLSLLPSKARRDVLLVNQHNSIIYNLHRN